MGTVAVGVIALLSLMRSMGAMDNCSSELPPTQSYFPDAFPGDFFGNSTLPSDCSGTEALICLPDRVPILDGISGATPGSVDPSEFLAWNKSSRFTLVRAGEDVDTLGSVRQITLYFYHEPASGIGLPEFQLGASTSDRTPGDPITYTILNNQDLTVDDAQVRNVTLAFTEPTPSPVNRIHIGFSLTSSIRQFAVSEVQLCSDEANIKAENLTLELTSEPLPGPDILLPANRTGRDENATVRLSCTVANQGRFEWEWTPPSTTPQVSDDTRTSTVEIPRVPESVGDYTCTARYHPDTGLEPSSTTETFTIGLERLLFADMNEIDITDSTAVTLKCILAGYDIDAEQISWSFNGRPITSGTDNYLISVSSMDCPPYGTCGLGLLVISSLDSDDAGEYVCSFKNLSQIITLVTVPSESSTQPPPGTTNDNLIPIIAGLIAAVVVLILVVIFVLIIVICCCNRRGSQKSAVLSNTNGLDDDDVDGLYTMIPKTVPPPLPSRPIPGIYATIDLKDNGHIEMTSLTLRDSIISMPADIGRPSSDSTLGKLSGNNQALPLRPNPLYSSADNIIHGAPPLPEKRFSSSTGILDEDAHSLNIYAIPHKPPSLPERMMSPYLEAMELVPCPIYSETAITPAKFQSAATAQSPDRNSKICPYASIYADPKPLLKEEGPMEIRPYHIKEIRQLGTGQFGEVMLAETLGLSLRDLKLGDSNDKAISIQVAVKRLKQDAEKTVKEAFEKEIKFMARLNHMNVIRMLAICPTGHPFILMEYMEHGDLNQYLQRYEIAPPGTELTANQIAVASLLYACVQISNGMRYLASQHFIHRDLATRNFLVGNDNIIKIADFGMSRSLYSSHYYRIQGRAILPIRWMANECFYGQFSEKTDVWAFGVAMWEVFTLAKEQPYNALSDQEVIENTVNTENMKLLEKPEHCPEEVYEVMLQCWERDPDKRINFEDVYSSLAALHAYNDI